MKRLSKFTKIYLACVAVFFLALTVFLLWLNSAVSKYNDKLPETVAQRFFTSAFVNTDADKILSLAQSDWSEFDDADDIKEFLNKSFEGDISFTSVSSQNENEKKYIIKSGDYKVADFILSKNENELWTPTKVNLYLSKYLPSPITILSSSTLWVNDIKVSDDYVTETVPGVWSDYLPEGVEGPEWVTYTLPAMTKEHSLRVVDRNSNTPELEEKDGVLIEKIIYDEEEKEISDRILEGALQYAKCMQNDVFKSSVYPYFEKGSNVYLRIEETFNFFAIKHESYEFENVEVSEFFRYDENTVSVRISFVHVLKKAGNEDYRNPTDITYFARLVDGEYKIFAFLNN